MIAEYNNNIRAIAEIVNGKLSGSETLQINAVTTDSRMAKGKCLFIPIKGEKFDGHDFIEKLCSEKKIAAFLTEKKELTKITDKYKIPSIICDSTLQALGALAGDFRSKFKLPIIGITGTNGKTTTKELLHCAMSANFKVFKNEKNFNNEIGVPFSLLGLTDDYNCGIIEMGMNHAGEISRLTNIVKPDCSIITNVGEGHLEFLETVEKVAEAKSEIYESMSRGSLVFLNRDSACLEIMKRNADKRNLNILYYGLDRYADYYPEKYTLLPDKIIIKYKDEDITVPIYGLHNVYNIMACIAVADYYKVSLKKIKKALLSFVNIDNRNEVIHKDDYTIINDTYNSNPLSLKSALVSLDEIYPDNRKIAVLSDMKELGEKESEYHFDAGETVYRKTDALFTWGKLAEKISEGAVYSGMEENTVFHFSDKKDLIKALKKYIKSGDAILVKGSRSMKMEEVADSIR